MRNIKILCLLALFVIFAGETYADENGKLVLTLGLGGTSFDKKTNASVADCTGSSMLFSVASFGGRDERYSTSWGFGGSILNAEYQKQREDASGLGYSGEYALKTIDLYRGYVDPEDVSFAGFVSVGSADQKVMKTKNNNELTTDVHRGRTLGLGGFATLPVFGREKKGFSLGFRATYYRFDGERFDMNGVFIVHVTITLIN